jgi:hypothetical protein
MSYLPLPNIGRTTPGFAAWTEDNGLALHCEQVTSHGVFSSVIKWSDLSVAEANYETAIAAFLSRPLAQDAMPGLENTVRRIGLGKTTVWIALSSGPPVWKLPRLWFGRAGKRRLGVGWLYRAAEFSITRSRTTR